MRSLPASVFPGWSGEGRWNAHDDQTLAVGRVITEIVERVLDGLQMPGGVGLAGQSPWYLSWVSGLVASMTV